MTRKSIDRLWLGISIVSFFVMSLFFMLIAIQVDRITMDRAAFNTLKGCVFWISLTCGAVSQVVLALRRREWYKDRNVDISKSSVKRIGLISFARNRLATVFDTIMVISLCVLIAATILSPSMWIYCLIVAILSFSFCMHCILNGKIYHHILHH